MSIKASKIIGKTQRNWDYDLPVSEEEIKYLVNVSLNAPVKENHNLYKLLVSTNIEFNQMIQEWAYNTDTEENTKEITALAFFRSVAKILEMQTVARAAVWRVL